MTSLALPSSTTTTSSEVVKRATSTRTLGGGRKKPQQFMLPSELSDLFYSRALKLYTDGYDTSIELERMIKELSKASSFLPDQFQHYLLDGNIYKKASDLSSAIYSYRYYSVFTFVFYILFFLP